ncbi:MAG TPA: hypothetical protein ENK59_07795 [Thioploca sp.]|nr:hypothetical protein [Thioploca sp.]
MSYSWQQLELFDIGFASKGVNKIHYFSSNDIYYPSPLCDRDILGDDFSLNYSPVKINDNNRNNICEICLAEYKRLMDRKLKLHFVSSVIRLTSFDTLR